MNFSNIILGSQSKQRAQILSYFHLPFLQYPSYFDEKTIDKSLPPQEYVTTLSKQKSNSLTTSYRDHFILTADTIVYQDGVIFNKPQDEHEAINMLCQLMGKQHSVYTGMTLSFNEKSFTDYQITNLHLHDNIPIKYLKNYIRTFHEKITIFYLTTFKEILILKNERLIIFKFFGIRLCEHILSVQINQNFFLTCG